MMATRGNSVVDWEHPSGSTFEFREQSNEGKVTMDTYVYVYGTLKRELYNYVTYLQPAIAQGKAEFVGVGRTARADFHLVLKRDRHVPCLYRAPTEGYQVPGEVYRVDADALEALDILEAVGDKYYLREEIDVNLVEGERKGETLKCQAYIMPISEELTALERIPDYTKELHVGYKSRSSTPRLEILKHIYGQEITDAVQTRLDQGMPFTDAWQEVVGA